MAELHWNFGWTLAALGVCWLALSCVVALGIGQIIKRSKASSEAEQSASLEARPGLPELMHMDAVFGSRAEARASTNSQELEHDGLPAAGYGSRAASGTRLKPVQLESELEKPARKVS